MINIHTQIIFFCVYLLLSHQTFFKTGFLENPRNALMGPFSYVFTSASSSSCVCNFSATAFQCYVRNVVQRHKRCYWGNFSQHSFVCTLLRRFQLGFQARSLVHQCTKKIFSIIFHCVKTKVSKISNFCYNKFNYFLSIIYFILTLPYITKGYPYIMKQFIVYALRIYYNKYVNN